MHHPQQRIAYTTVFVTPVVVHWLEREIAQWVHPMKDRPDDPSHHEQMLLSRRYISLRIGNEDVIVVIYCQFGNLHTYIHTYIHRYVHTYMHIYIHAYINTYMHTYIHTYIHTYVHRCIHTYIHTCTHTHTCIHTYIIYYISFFAY